MPLVVLSPGLVEKGRFIAVPDGIVTPPRSVSISVSAIGFSGARQIVLRNRVKLRNMDA